MQINPDLLNGKTHPAKLTQQRIPEFQKKSSLRDSPFTLLKLGIFSSLVKFFTSHIIRVSMDTREQKQSMQDVMKLLRRLSQDAKTLEVKNGSNIIASVEKMTQLVQHVAEDSRDFETEKGGKIIEAIHNFHEEVVEAGKDQNGNIEKLISATGAFDSIVGSLQTGNKVDQEKALLLKRISQDIKDVNNGLAMLLKKETIFPVSELVSEIKALQTSFSKLKLEVPKVPDIKIPAYPTSLSITEGKSILKSLQKLTDSIERLPHEFPQTEFPNTINVANFPPQKYPMPVTNININPLHGYVKSSAQTVAQTAVGLPGTPLANRRSLTLYNNSSNTIFIGGSDVTANNGVPVPASTWGSALDAGTDMIIYGISSTGSNDVRILEVSNTAIGTHTNL